MQVGWVFRMKYAPVLLYLNKYPCKLRQEEIMEKKAHNDTSVITFISFYVQYIPRAQVSIQNVT